MRQVCVMWHVPLRNKLLCFLVVFQRVQNSRAGYLRCLEDLDNEGVGIAKRAQGLGQPLV